MTDAEFHSLLGEIRRGRTEGDSVEWKRQWWPLETDEGKAEFRRDVASLANSCQGSGLVILGLKNGRLFNAPPPADEAALQQILDSIVPTPAVALSVLTIEGTTVSVLSVRGPFDRPYVTRTNDVSFVFVRHGSSIDTASRFELDLLYKTKRRQPSLKAEWQAWVPATIDRHDDKSTRSATLGVLAPEVRHAAEVEHIYERQLIQLRESHGREGFPTAGQLAEFEQDFGAFRQSLQDERNLLYWFTKRFGYTRSTPFTIVFDNDGTEPATDTRLHIEFPPWLLLFDKLPESAPKTYTEPPATPLRPEPPQSRLDALSGLVRTSVPYPFRWTPPLIESVHKSSGIWADDPKKGHATFWANRVLHAHELIIDDTLYVLALPSTPVSPTSFRVDARIFCAENETWQPIDLKIRVDGGL